MKFRFSARAINHKDLFLVFAVAGSIFWSQAGFSQLATPAQPQIELLKEADVDVKPKDRKAALLQSSDRQGFGSGATGGSNYIEVSSFSELKNAMETENSYVILSSSLADKQVGFTSTIWPANNITLDGSDAPGAVLYPDYDGGFSRNSPMFSINGSDTTGNQIFYSIKMDGKRSSSYTSSHPSYNVGAFFLRRGNNYWFHRVEITEFWDDAVSCGRQADYVTFSNMKVHNTDKGILLFYPDSSSHGKGHISILNTELSAAGRNPWNTGGESLHIWNSYIHNWRWLGNGVGYKGTNSTSRTVAARTLSENNFYENGVDGIAERAETNEALIAGWMYTVGSIFNDTRQRDSLHLIRSRQSNVGPGVPSIPYNYTLREGGEVKAYVRDNAGPVR